MTGERELERHNRILNEIEEAKDRNELPSISYASIASYLATNVYFDKVHLSATDFAPAVDTIINNNGIIDREAFKESLVKIVKDNYPDVHALKMESVLYKVLSSPRIAYMLEEIDAKNARLDYITKEENYKLHSETMKDIRNATDAIMLPKVGMGLANQKIVRAFNDNDYKNDFKVDDIKEIREAFIRGESYDYMRKLVNQICLKYGFTGEELDKMVYQISNNLIWDETIEFTIDEVLAKDKRVLEIYKMDHDHNMEAIKTANRISQLPPNLTASTLTSYLTGNATIYTNDNRLKAEDIKPLANLLYDGYKWEDEVVKSKLKEITDRAYPEKADAFDLLYNKLSSLPRTYYIAEEVNLSLQRQREFIGRGGSNVNVYFLPSNKSPMNAGKFYTCYINRVDNLDLSGLPLNLEELVPEKIRKDKDVLEYYVQEHIDPSFKAAGGIILNADEKIGQVNVFRPNDGKLGVTVEEKEKMDQIGDLEAEIETKQAELTEVEHKTKTANDRYKELLINYKKKAMLLQAELLSSIERIEEELGEDKGVTRGGSNE